MNGWAAFWLAWALTAIMMGGDPSIVDAIARTMIASCGG